jgi:hypothetical protein
MHPKLEEMGRSAIDHPLYHGSKGDQPIERFESTYTGTNSTAFSDYEVDRVGVFLTDNLAFAQQCGDAVGEYAVSATSVVEYQKAISDFIAHLDHEDLTGLKSAVRDLAEPWMMFDNEMGREFVSWLRNNGYDAVIVPEAVWVEDEHGEEEELPSNTVVVLDPKLVRYVGQVERRTQGARRLRM